MTQFDQLATDEALSKTVSALISHGINTSVVENAAEAKNEVYQLIPSGSQVMTMTSVTLDSLNLSSDINQSSLFQSVKNQLNNMDRQTQNLEMQQLGSAPEYTIGSVHAVTQNGEVLIASNTGSQLPAYAYGSPNVIWVVSTKKIVPDLKSAMDRIYKYSFPLENERAQKAYGTGSAVNKILIINGEVNPNRLHLIFIKENLGF